MIRLIQHLLPRARAWSLSGDKPLRSLFEGVSASLSGVKTYADLIWLDLLPETTRQLDDHERQLDLSSAGLTTQERRDRLAFSLANIGGQSPRYLQDTIQLAGFGLYIHEWWDPDTLATRDPTVHLDGDPGYPLADEATVRNRVDLTDAGDTEAEAGESFMLAGNFIWSTAGAGTTVPTDPTKWPFFIYFGGETFPDVVQIPIERKEELELLCRRICPGHLWLGMLVEYV